MSKSNQNKFEPKTPISNGMSYQQPPSSRLQQQYMTSPSNLDSSHLAPPVKNSKFQKHSEKNSSHFAPLEQNLEFSEQSVISLSHFASPVKNSDFQNQFESINSSSIGLSTALSLLDCNGPQDQVMESTQLKYSPGLWNTDIFSG